MKKKFVYIFAVLTILLSCTDPKKSYIDGLYKKAKSATTTNPCEVYYRYNKLLKEENRMGSDFHLQIAKDAIGIYKPKCGFSYEDIQTFRWNYFDGSGGNETRESLFLECDFQTEVITKKEILSNKFTEDLYKRNETRNFNKILSTEKQVKFADLLKEYMPEDSKLLLSNSNYKKMFIHLSKREGEEKFEDYQYIIAGFDATKSDYWKTSKSGFLKNTNPSSYGFSTTNFEIDRQTLSLLHSRVSFYPVGLVNSNYKYEREVSINSSTKCIIDTEANENWFTNIYEIIDGFKEKERLKDLDQRKEQAKQELNEMLKRKKEAEEQEEKNII